MLPGAFPVLGHAPALYRDVPELLRTGHAKLGPLFWLCFKPKHWVVSCGGLDGLEVLKKKAYSTTKAQFLSPLVAGQWLLPQEGDTHRGHRAVMNPPFVQRGLNVGTVGAMMAEVITTAVTSWLNAGQVKILAQTRTFGLDIIFRMFNVTPEEVPTWRAKYSDLLLGMLEIPLDFRGSPNDRAARARQWIDTRFRELIAASRRSGDTSSVIGALAHAYDNEANAMDEQVLVDNLRMLILSEHETMASTMAWLVIRLAGQPNLWEPLCDEVNALTSVPATPEAARACPYAEALFREIVRMHPAFGMIHRAVDEPVELAGYKLEPGTQVGVELWSIAHDPAFFEEPDEFKPSRWLGRSGPPTPIEISQFGTGPHFCLGYHLAWLETVQLAVVAAREASRRGVRPRIKSKTGKVPAPIFLPLEHPPPSTVIEFI